MENNPSSASSITFEYIPKPWFDLTLVIIMNILGIFISLLFFAILLVVMIFGIFLLREGIDGGNIILSLLGAVMAILAIPMVFFFNPCAQLNPFLCWKARSTVDPVADTGDQFVCQVSFSPRLQKGLQSALDDADDIGMLTIGQQGLTFHGGFCRFSLPLNLITSMEGKFNIFPGFCLSGRRLILHYNSEHGEGKLEVEHRQGLTVIDQFSKSLKLINVFRSRLPQVSYRSKLI